LRHGLVGLNSGTTFVVQVNRHAHHRSHPIYLLSGSNSGTSFGPVHVQWQSHYNTLGLFFNDQPSNFFMVEALSSGAIDDDQWRSNSATSI
jgi:hypothetical protein